jgi:hypothetical protein
VVPAARRGRQEGHQFGANLGYSERPCLKREGGEKEREREIKGNH